VLLHIRAPSPTSNFKISPNRYFCLALKMIMLSLPEKRQKAQRILQEGGKKYQFQLFQGVSHGFAVRCNLDDPYERYVKEQSYRGIVEWFNFWLSQ
jgi:dienelactone hydrolase